jgi:hypothetical protein
MPPPEPRAAALGRTWAKFSPEEREALMERQRRFEAKLAAAATPEEASRIAQREWVETVERPRAVRRVAAALKLVPARTNGREARPATNGRRRGSRRTTSARAGPDDDGPEPPPPSWWRHTDDELLAGFLAGAEEARW